MYVCVSQEIGRHHGSNSVFHSILQREGKRGWGGMEVEKEGAWRGRLAAKTASKWWEANINRVKLHIQAPGTLPAAAFSKVSVISRPLFQ